MYCGGLGLNDVAGEANCTEGGACAVRVLAVGDKEGAVGIAGRVG